MTDNCFVVDSPQQNREGFCHVSPPWSAGSQVKFSGVHPLPWDLQASFTFQNLPGIPISANYVATNAVVAPSLGRNLAAGAGSTVLIPIIEPQTMFEDRLTQVDVRLTKIVRVGRARVQGMFDVYNLFNAGTILGVNSTYGSAWLRPTNILGARLFKFGAKLDF